MDTFLPLPCRTLSSSTALHGWLHVYFFSNHWQVGHSMVRLVFIFSPMLWDATVVYPPSAVLLSCPCDTVILCSVLPCTLHLHFCSQITHSCTSPSPFCSQITYYCTSPLPCLPLGFSTVLVLFPRPAEITFFFSATHYRFELAPAVTGAPPISGSAHLSVPVCNREHKKNFVTSLSLLHNNFF